MPHRQDDGVGDGGAAKLGGSLAVAGAVVRRFRAGSVEPTFMGGAMTRDGNSGASLLFCGGVRRRIAAGVVVGICAAGWARPAAAYRPFDGTDAAVADVGEVEIEFQPLGAAHAGGTTKGLTDVIVNYGFADRWELVLQSTPQVPPEGFGPISVSNGAFLKYVLQPGVLQEKSGPSIATEFGVLLPEIGGSGAGIGWAGIASQRWDWGTVHFYLATNLTPDQHGELFLDTILEGPNKWKVRPVAEFYFDKVFNEAQTYSA